MTKLAIIRSIRRQQS